ncbi:MAG: SAM-dependent methyltransferase, partial [Bacteroidota bacterium]|nr:SAM-dependent methyltransferase [Bacteroidota bacterium]
MGEVELLEVLPIAVKKKIEDIDIYIVESEKSARRFINTICPDKSQEKLKLFTLNKFTETLEIPNYLNPCIEQGESIGLISDAGCPAVADPGSGVVRLAHERNIKVVPIVG